MAKRPTLRDVARAAGVSIATVNRVVSAEPNVRNETARKVANAAQEVGYHGHNLLNQQVKQSLPLVKLGFVLHKERQKFYQEFANVIRIAAAQNTKARISIDIEFSQSQSPQDVSELMMEMSSRVDALAATAVNHRIITDTVSQIEARGIKCFSLLSDFAQGERSSYFGLNNLKVGRGVAQALTKFIHKTGDIALFVGGNRWHGHELRETGFRSQLREMGTTLNVLDTLVNLETRQLTYEATLELLQRYPNVVGIYLAGGGMEGAIEALREEVPPNKIALIVNECTQDSLAALEDGYVSMIVGTPLREMCMSLISAMIAPKTGDNFDDSGQVFFKPELVMAEFQ